MSSLRWSKIRAPPLPRSSHSISVIKHQAYIFGGEITPREPCDNVVHKIDLKTVQYEQIHGRGDVPAPRVGHVAAAIAGQIYIFGGRGGKAMSPLEEAGAVYTFEPSSSTWTRIQPKTSNYPEARSYHCATSTSTHLIVHGGCGAASGSRFRDVWAFDVTSKEWIKLPDAPGDPRGGSAICHSDGNLWRFGGYNGKTEIGGEIDCLVLPPSFSTASTAQWETRPFSSSANAASGPGSRSVCALLPLQGAGKLVTFLGEGNPSPTGGHDAAGNFWGDVWTYDPASNEWDAVAHGGEDGPGERGWFAATSSDAGAVIWGGINGRNERLDNGYVLSA